MSATDPQVIPLPVNGPSIDEGSLAPAIEPALTESHLGLLFKLDPERPDPKVLRDLETWLAEEKTPQLIWKLLRCLDEMPPRSVNLDVVLAALTRLVEANSVFLRAAAYRWLAGLHEQNLRYEMRAKNVLRRGLDRESGSARKRVEMLLRRC